MSQPQRTPYSHKIRYGVTGAPIITEDEMDGSHAPGVGIAPTLIELVYSAAQDGLPKVPASVSASVTGWWTRFGKRDQSDHQVITHFANDPEGWPAWLATEARLHDPERPPQPPADRTAVLLWAADALDDSERLRDLTDDHMHDVNAAANELRRLAAEAQQQEPVCGDSHHRHTGPCHLYAPPTQPAGAQQQPKAEALVCVCGAPVEWMDDPRDPGWIHRPGSDTPCLTVRPRCPNCGLPHDLTPGSMPVRACESILASIAEAKRLHAVGDHSRCARVDCEVVRDRAAEEADRG